MAKIKLTKGELKRQRDSLKQFQHYLPTLQLKKQQLQMKIREVMASFHEKDKALSTKKGSIAKWVGLLGDQSMNLSEWVMPTEIETGETNIAGVRVPTFKHALFPDLAYDYYKTPLWVDRAVEEIKGYFMLMAEQAVLKKQLDLLGQELRITTQRVNLFEKVKIPECQENIRMIRIYLGDQQANAVGISKVAKKKLEAVAV